MSSRKPKNLPKLPMSAFSPPNSGVSESFPLPPSPSTVHPARVIDADAAVSALATWKDNAPQAAKEVIVATDGTLDGLEAQAADAGVSIISVQIPFDLKSGALPSLPTTSLRISLRAAFAPAEEPLTAALRAGHVVDLDVDLKKDPDVWGTLEEVVGRAATTTEGEAPIEGKIVLGGLLPPPHDLSLPLVQLLKDKTYVDYQGQVASISLLPGTFIKFLPPNWDAPIPDDEKEKKEWKRRIKMYLGPVVEAFGFERIIFGSGRARVADWYALARESFAELGVDQDAVDAIFGGNAARVYGPRDGA